MPAALIIVSLLVLILYCGRLSWYLFSFSNNNKLQYTDVKGNRKNVSVIIPVRNEAIHLHNLFNDLMRQDYYPGDYEVVFVDDHSTDNSPLLLEEFCNAQTNSRVITLPHGIGGKKNAIATGIENSKGEWIIQADADCRLPENYISGHVSFASPGIDLVAGPVVVQPGESTWSKLEALEQFSLTATTLGAAAAGRPVMCSGANLSYSKAIYLELANHLSAIPHVSGDDVFLLAEAKKRQSTIRFMSAPETLVTTLPAGGPQAFLRQRIRWGSKSKYYTDRDMSLLAIQVWLTNVLVAVLLIASPFVNGVIWLFLSVLLIKSLTEYMLLRKVADRLGQKHLISLFPVAALFYYFYVALAGTLSLMGSFTWKGRTNKS